MFKGDVGTVLTFTCKDSEGTAMNFATATSVWLYIDRKDTILKREMTISSATAGITTYTITNEDFTKGDRTYLFQVEVHYGEEANIDVWQTRVGGETSSLEVVNDLIEALPPSESERLNFVESALDTLLGG